MNLKQILDILFAPRKRLGEVEIKFHTEANYFGEHGTICVTHVKKGLVETSVRFVFAGVTTPPKMDLATFSRIWEEAKTQGYIPHHIETYGRVNEIIDTTQEAPEEESPAQGWVPPIEETIRTAESLAGRRILHVVSVDNMSPEKLQEEANRLTGGGFDRILNSPPFIDGPTITDSTGDTVVTLQPSKAAMVAGANNAQ
jgi:hypothetical protein